MIKRLNKKYTAIMLAVIVLQLNSCNNDDRKGIKTEEIQKVVEVSKVEKKLDTNEIPYSGTIVESESFPLNFSVVGTVNRVFVSEGEYVKKGQLLAELNEESYKYAYEMTLATLKQAEDAYKRLKPMYDNANLQEIKMVEVETGLQQAKSASYIAKKNLEDCKLYSPVSGVVGKRSIEPGMNTIPNLTSIEIIKIEKVFAKIPVSENDISSIRKGDKARIKISALNGKIFDGMIEDIGVLADPIAHTYMIKIGIANSSYQIKPGMICNVLLIKSNATSVLSIPTEAILVDEQGRRFVYTVNQNKAQRKYIELGKLLKNGVEITSGLNDGELIVIAGQQKLVDNSLVQIINQ